MIIPEELQTQIAKDIKENTGWLVNGMPVEIPDGAISVIMAIIRIRLEAV